MPTPARSDATAILSPAAFSFGHRTWPQRVAIAAACTALLALCAHISVALPFTPIPVTMQTFAVLLVGMLLGPAAGAATLVLYLAEGAAGLPMFSPHGPGGLAQLAGPSAGYLLSYPAAAALAGSLFAAARRIAPAAVAALATAVLADALILLSGSAWLMASLHLSLTRAIAVGSKPFLAGEAVKVALLAVAVTTLRPSAVRTR